jgi:SapC
MTFPPMYRSMVALDRAAHKGLRMRTDYALLNQAAPLNSVFLNAVEFADACREFPIVFVRTGQGQDGKPAPVAPLAVLGLKAGENLFISEGRWTGDYAPAYLRRYPFAMARLDDSDQLAVCVDEQWEAFSPEGEPLFTEAGEPTELLQNIVKFLESFEGEVERTRRACLALDEAGVLEPMRFEAQMAGGDKIEVDGFLAVNQEKLNALPDATVLEFHRNGLLQLLEMHRLSLSNMGRFAEKRNKA